MQIKTSLPFPPQQDTSVLTLHFGGLQIDSFTLDARTSSLFAALDSTEAQATGEAEERQSWVIRGLYGPTAARIVDISCSCWVTMF
jgi:hypothetical protein